MCHFWNPQISCQTRKDKEAEGSVSAGVGQHLTHLHLTEETDTSVSQVSLQLERKQPLTPWEKTDNISHVPSLSEEEDPSPPLLAPPCHSALLSFLLIYQTSSFPCCHIWYRWLGSMEWPVSPHSAASVWQGAWWFVKGPRLPPVHGLWHFSKGGLACSLPTAPQERNEEEVRVHPKTAMG